MVKFEMRVLIIIILFGVVFFFGLLFICKYKFYLWILRKDDFEFDIGVGFKVDVKNLKVVSNGVGKLYVVFVDLEFGNKGVELELDFVLIVQLGKSVNCKFFCV